MPKRDNGGPVFPQPDRTLIVPYPEMERFVAGTPGLTLLDWFAGQALPAVMARKEGLAVLMNATKRDPTMIVAQMCYELADALLTERERAR